MLAKPANLRIRAVATGVHVQAQITEMSPEQAEEWIDIGWWIWTGAAEELLTREPDSHWDWRELVTHLQVNEDAEAIALSTTDGEIQGAIYLPYEPSILQPDKRALYVERLAVAPWNRTNINRPHRYSGVGTALMEFAVLESFAMGCDGRTLLASLPLAATLGFYARFGLVDTGAKSGPLPLLELPAPTADTIRRAIQDRGT